MSDQVNRMMPSDIVGASISGGQCSREKYWDELSHVEKIEKLGQIIEFQDRKLRSYGELIDKLYIHQHGLDGKIVTPLNLEREMSWKSSNPLHREKV